MAYKYNPLTGELDLVNNSEAGFSGPGSSTDNAVVRWDGTSGDTVKDSGIIVDDSDNVTGLASLTLNTAGALRTSTSDTNTALLQAYDVNGASYTTFTTLTAGNTPTMDLSDDVTKASNYIYRAAGTDVPVTDGGTGNSSATAYAVLCGGTTSTGSLQSIASVGTSGQVLTSNGAAALPTFQDAGGGAWEFVSSATASNSSTIEFTDLSASYFMYRVVIDNIQPASDNVYLYLRTSSNNGSSFDSGTSDYEYSALAYDSSFGDQSDGSTGDNAIVINGEDSRADMGNNTAEQGAFTVDIYNPGSASRTRVHAIGTLKNSSASPFVSLTSGFRDSVADVDAIQFLFSSGNISTGEFKLYRLAAS